jgi:hypothetical protein
MGRAWIVGASVLGCLLLTIVGIGYLGKHPSVSPPLQATDCLVPAPKDELANDAFVRRGGRIARYPKGLATGQRIHDC